MWTDYADFRRLEVSKLVPTATNSIRLAGSGVVTGGVTAGVALKAIALTLSLLSTIP